MADPEIRLIYRLGILRENKIRVKDSAGSSRAGSVFVWRRGFVGKECEGRQRAGRGGRGGGKWKEKGGGEEENIGGEEARRGKIREDEGKEMEKCKRMRGEG